MQALEQLLLSHEFENISVQDIAKQAGVAVGSVYSHFKDKTAFLEVLLDHWKQQVETQLVESEAQDLESIYKDIDGLRTALLTMTQAVYMQIQQSGHVLRAIHTYTRLHPNSDEHDWAQLVIRSFRPIETLLTIFEDEITVKNRKQSAYYLGFVFNTIFIRPALMPQDTLMDAADLDSETLISETADMLYAYLVQPRA